MKRLNERLIQIFLDPFKDLSGNKHNIDIYNFKFCGILSGLTMIEYEKNIIQCKLYRKSTKASPHLEMH